MRTALLQIQLYQNTMFVNTEGERDGNDKELKPADTTQNANMMQSSHTLGFDLPVILCIHIKAYTLDVTLSNVRICYIIFYILNE